MDTMVGLYEELSFNAHPALNTVLCDGWILRFADGYTNRANSVHMLHPPQMPLADKINFCEWMYTKQKQPTVFKITPLSLDVDSALAKRGYSVVTPTNVMVMDISASSFHSANSVVVCKQMDEAWQNDYFRLNQTNAQIIPVAKQVQRNMLNPALTATLYDGTEMVACGLCVIEREYAGLYGIAVSPQFRRKGCGYDICTALMNAAKACGAQKVYLQVVANNAGAIALYKKLGFTDAYQYWYRVKNIQQAT